MPGAPLPGPLPPVGAPIGPPSEEAPEDPFALADPEPDDWGEWGDESDEQLNDLLDGGTDEEQDDYFARTLAATAGWYTLIGTPGCGSHAPPAACHAYHGVSVAAGCTAGSAPCNWQSVNAVDVRLPVGTKLTPVERGVVSRRFGYGLMARSGRFAGYRLHVEHPGGWVSFYTHLARTPFVVPGQTVGRDTILGVSGAANGVPHLHLALTPPRDPRSLWQRSFLRGTAGGTVPAPTPAPPPGLPPPLVAPGVDGLETAWSRFWRDSHSTRVQAADQVERARTRLRRFTR